MIDIAFDIFCIEVKSLRYLGLYALLSFANWKYWKLNIIIINIIFYNLILLSVSYLYKKILVSNIIII